MDHSECHDLSKSDKTDNIGRSTLVESRQVPDARETVISHVIIYHGEPACNRGFSSSERSHASGPKRLRYQL